MIERIKQIFNFNKKEQLLDKTPEEKIQELFDSLNGEIITFKVGNDFTEFQDIVNHEIANYREKLQKERGFVLPLIHVVSEDSLQENEFIVMIRERTVQQKFVIPNIKDIQKEVLSSLEYIVDSELENLFSYEILEKYLNCSQQRQPWTIWNLTICYSLAEIKDVLVGLLRKDKSIKNIDYIFGKIVDITLESGFCSHIPTNKIVEKLILKL